MPKTEWGVKRTCPNCDTRFYDLQREPIQCPECGATFNVDDRGKVSATRERRVPVAAAVKEDPLVDEEDLVEDSDEEEAEDDPLLADDEDEDEEPAGPALAEEETEGEGVAFKETSIIDNDIDDEDDDEDEDDQDGDEEIDEFDDVPVKNKDD